MSRPTALEKRLGHRFADARLLEQALTHRSHGADNNERLEFLGDGVLGCAVADELYARFPQLPEGKLTRLRASLVREEALARGGERPRARRAPAPGRARARRRSRAQPSILADAVEALFGAVFLDGGYEAARERGARRRSAPLLEQPRPRPGRRRTPRRACRRRCRRAASRLPEYRVVAAQGAAAPAVVRGGVRRSELDLRATGSGHLAPARRAAGGARRCWRGCEQ